MNKASALEEGQFNEWLACYCWFYRFLQEEDKVKFRVLLSNFLKDANFVGSGIDVTLEMKVAISGWAVLLVLNRPLNITWYRNIESIVIFPGSVLESKNALGLMVSGFHYCHIHFAWDHLRDSATKFGVKGNTILHEFAHALDHLNRDTNGQPSVMLTKDELDLWKRVFNQEYIHKMPKYKRKKVWNFFQLDRWNKYNANDSSCVDVAELFATSTEFFFERPIDLYRVAPDVYDCLIMLYKLDPKNDFAQKTRMQKIWQTLFFKR